MLYLVAGDGLKKDVFDPKNGKMYLCVIDFEELKTAGDTFGISEKFIYECQRSGVSKFESHDGFDFLSLNVPDDTDQRKPPQRVCIYFTNTLLLFVCNNNQVVNDTISELAEEGLKSINLSKVLHLFLDKLTFDDAFVLEDIEQDISELEESLMMSQKSDMIDDIVALRKRLMTLKRYYEQLLEIAEDLEQNENELIDKKSLRYFRMITNRVDRLYHGVLNLRDYVTQVREAYQAQIDINLNSIMKIFTVVTSIFLPLTLLAGWYGMNLQMPEYGWEHGYLFVIAIGIAVTVMSVLYFKKHKWF